MSASSMIFRRPQNVFFREHNRFFSRRDEGERKTPESAEPPPPPPRSYDIPVGGTHGVARPRSRASGTHFFALVCTTYSCVFVLTSSRRGTFLRSSIWWGGGYRRAVSRLRFSGTACTAFVCPRLRLSGLPSTPPTGMRRRRRRCSNASRLFFSFILIII